MLRNIINSKKKFNKNNNNKNKKMHLIKITKLVHEIIYHLSLKVQKQYYN